MTSATRITVSSFGALVGVAGIEHGIGEALQGNVAPSALVFPSWAGDGPFAVLSGEPALTIIPNLLAAGIVTIAISLAFLTWVVLFIESKHGRAILIILSIAMLLAGGGLFPPVLGIVLAGVASRIHLPNDQDAAHSPPGWRQVIAILWSWSVGIGLIIWLLVMPGLPAFVFFFGYAPPEPLVYALLLGMFVFLFTSILTGFVRDSRPQIGNRSRADSPQTLAVS